MGSIAEDFINKFHSLQGTSIAEKRKNLFILLHQNALPFRKNLSAMDYVSSNLEPKSFLEELFRLEFLIYFRRTQVLYQLLVEGNEVFVSKIVKLDWFFEEVFANLEATKIVNEILPKMSYSVRMKVLGRLCRWSNSNQFDKIFDAVAERYGIFIASKFIHGCSSDKIRDVISQYPVKLKDTQLKIILNKDRDLLDRYFHCTKISRYDYAYRNFLKYLFVEDRHLFDKWQKEYEFNINFGRRLTKKIVVEKKNDIMKNPDKFRHLNMRSVLRKLGKDSKTLFCNALPPKFESIYEVAWLVKHFPKKYYNNLYMNVIQSHYNSKFIDHPKLIRESLIKLLSEETERALHARIKVDEGRDEFIKYLQVKESIPLLKEKINLTSDIMMRGRFIENLVETCHINNDISELVNIMKYFNFRHKNYYIDVHLRFISQIENLFGFKNFSEEMWNLLNDLLLIHTLKFVKDRSTYQKIQTLPLVKFNLGTSLEQKWSYLEFLFLRNENIDDLLAEYFTVHNELPTRGSFNKDFEKYFLLYAINRPPDTSDSKQIIDYNCSQISRIFQWNLHYKDDKLSIYDYPSLLNAFKHVVNNYDYVFHDFKKELRSYIFTTISNSYRDEYLEIYWKRFNEFGEFKDLLWFLRFDSTIILKYFDIFVEQIVRYAIKPQRELLYIVKKFSHLQLDEKIKSFYFLKLSDDTCLEQKPQFIPCLSILMKPDEYSTLAESYKPVNKSLDLKSETEVRLYNLQCALASNFKNSRSHVGLTSLLNYCMGDYFKYAMTSLYSIMYRTPEELLPQYLNFLSNKAVSVRKHALYLICELSTVSNVETVIRALNKSEGVESLQKLMLISTLKYFTKNPIDQFFELIKLNMRFINKADDETLNIVVDQYKKMPSKYKAPYIQYTWEFLETKIEIWEKLKCLKQILLSGLDVKVCQDISLEFGLHIIRTHFLTDKPIELLGFIFNFMHGRKESDIIFEAVSSILDSVDESHCLKFFNSCYDKIMPITYDVHFNPLVKYYEKKIESEQHFSEFIKFFFLKMKTDLPCSGNNVDEISRRIYTFFQKLITEFGPHIIYLFGTELESAYYHFSDQDFTKYQYYLNLIEKYPEADVAVVILGFISKPLSSRDAKTFHRTLQIIKNVDNKGVRVILRSRFNSFASKAYREMEGDEMEIKDSL